MTGGDGNDTDIEGVLAQIESCDTCDSCTVCSSRVCQSCGMPMTNPAHYGGGNTENEYCVNCCDSEGGLKSYGEVLENLTGLMMQTRNMEQEPAEKAAIEYLAIMPAWCGR